MVNEGERVPIDGEVTKGHGSVDESMLSGESLPVEKETGQRLTGGTILVSGSVYMKVTATGRNTVSRASLASSKLLRRINRRSSASQTA